MACSRVTINRRLSYIVSNDKMAELMKWLEVNSWESEELREDDIINQPSRHIPQISSGR